MTPAPLHVGQAPSELELKSAGFTPLAFANALRIGSRRPVYVAGLLRREPRIAPWSITTTPSRPATEPSISELFPEPATPVSTQSTPSGMSTSTSWRLCVDAPRISSVRSEEQTSELQSRPQLVCRLLLEKKKIASKPWTYTVKKLFTPKQHQTRKIP